MERLLGVLSAATLAACVCQPPAPIACHTPTIGSGLEEEVCIPGDTYSMGADAIPFGPLYLYPDGGLCPEDQAVVANCSAPLNPAPLNDWAPKHPVKLKPFYLDRYEVTNAAYLECVTAGACTFPVSGLGTTDPVNADHPVGGLNWFQAHDYCMWKGKRLPTEAEWEVAARGPKGFDYPWGNEEATPPVAPAVAPFEAVGTQVSDVSPFGVHDMWGGSAEWLNDWYDGLYYQTSPLEDPQGPPNATEGMAWCCAADHYRSKNSWRNERSYRNPREYWTGGYEWEISGRRSPVWFRGRIGPTAVGEHLGVRCARSDRASSQAALSMPVYRNLRWVPMGGPRK